MLTIRHTFNYASNFFEFGYIVQPAGVQGWHHKFDDFRDCLFKYIANGQLDWFIHFPSIFDFCNYIYFVDVNPGMSSWANFVIDFYQPVVHI